MFGFWSLILVPGIWPLGVLIWRILEWTTPLGPWLLHHRLQRELDRACEEWIKRWGPPRG